MLTYGTTFDSCTYSAYYMEKLLLVRTWTVLLCCVQLVVS